MKISALEKTLLGLTAAVLLVTGGYFLGVRSTAVPFRVETEYQTQREPPISSVPSASLPPEEISIVNINTATGDELNELPGIGKTRAEDIVADREINGPFRIPEDITRVKGIGEGTLVQIIDYITVG